MMKNRLVILLFALAVAACDPVAKPLPSELDDSYAPVSIERKVDAVQPSTGLVLWSENAQERDAAYGKSISLEYAYCLPCKVVTGKDNGTVRYDWSSFNKWLKDVSSRGHQAVVRFRYEYPGERNVDGKPGTTAVPDYIKALPDYNETFYENETLCRISALRCDADVLRRVRKERYTRFRNTDGAGGSDDNRSERRHGDHSGSYA